MARKYNIAELNDAFSIDRYISCSDSDRIDIRLELVNCIKGLRRSRFIVEVMKQEDVLVMGLKLENETAIAISILKQKVDGAGYEELFHFRDTIRILRKQLLKELFGGKNIFYDLGTKKVGYDPNYVPFILGHNIRLIERKRK